VKSVLTKRQPSKRAGQQPGNAHVNNVVAVIAEYAAASVDIDHTMEALVYRIDWTAIPPATLKEVMRRLLESTTSVNRQDLSEEADKERELLADYVREFRDCNCEQHKLADMKTRKQWHRDLRDMRRASGR
jgi:hypothetical protein